MSVSYNPSALLKSAKTTFAQNFNPDMSWVDKLCYRVLSDSNTEDHPWAGQPPQMVEMLDEVQFTPLSDANITLTNKIYAAGIEFNRKDIDDQKSGLLDMRVKQLAEVAGGHVNKLLSSMITNGATSGYNSYDGVTFFNDSHTNRGAEGMTLDNLIGSGSGTSTANLITDLSAAMSLMLNFASENGEPFWADATPRFYVMAPPALAHNWREVLEVPYAGTTGNVYQGVAELMVNPRLTATDANDWYLFAATDAIKPFIFQLRDPVEFSSQDGSQESDLTFTKERYRYKARARYEFGYAYWQAAVKIVNS